MAVNIQEKQILIDGLKVNYKIISDGNIPIILLHGWGVDSDKYTETARQFKIQNSKFKILLPDLHGFGKSDNPPEAWGADDYAEWLKNYAMAINLSSFVLIGHSFGGRIAIKFAVKYPEKLKTLILTGAAGIKHSPTTKQKIFYALAKTGKAFFSLPLFNYLRIPAQKLLYKAAQEKDYYQAEGVMRETFKKIIAEDLSVCLDKIIIPTLLVWGENDHSTPLSDAFIMKEKINDAHLEIVRGANHSLPYQKPEEFTQIVLDFIKNTNA